MLPGGLCILGLFLVTPPELSKDAQNTLKRVLNTILFIQYNAFIMNFILGYLIYLKKIILMKKMTGPHFSFY